MSTTAKVSGATFYHIWRNPDETISHLGKGRWEPGRSYEFGKEKNPQAKYFDATSYVVKNPNGNEAVFMNQALQAMEMLMERRCVDQKLVSFYHYNPFLALHEANYLIYHLLYIIRELIFEEVRKEKFPHLPSRSKCLFVINNNPKEVAWWGHHLLVVDRLAQGRETFPAALIEFSLTGRVFKTNRITGVFTPLVSAAPAYWREQAVKYWSGSVEDSPDAEEVLFAGTATVRR
ncbi:MAG: DUF2441 domain-containing protein, partial [Firmicutes bacterium]|nr:DUF2441 domain-containing protein [Bacillota bacterium]